MISKKLSSLMLGVALVCMFISGTVFAQTVSSVVLHVQGNSLFEGGNIYNKGDYLSWNGSSWVEQIGPAGADGVGFNTTVPYTNLFNGTNGSNGSNGTNGTNGSNGVDGNNGLMTCTYLIDTFTNATDTYYRAIRGNDSYVSWTSTNASQIFQNAADNVPYSKYYKNYVGKIHISAGDFGISNTIVQTKAVAWEGDGIGATHLYLTNGANCNMFNISYSGIIVGSEFKSFHMKGNSTQNTGASGIYITNSNCYDLLIDNMFIEDFPIDDVHTENVWAYKITNSIIEFGGRYGLYMGGGSDLRVVGSKIIYNNIGAYVGSSNRSSFVANYFYQNNQSAIEFNTAYNWNVEANQFIQNGYLTADTYADIKISFGGDNSRIIGNGFDSYGYAKYAVWANTTSSDNITISGNSVIGTYNAQKFFFYIAAGGGAVGNKFVNNDGYNPIGYIQYPFKANTAQMVDFGTNATISSDKTYTNMESPKQLIITGGTVTAITKNGQATGLTTGTIWLNSLDTFSITFSAAPTLVCYGE